MSTMLELPDVLDLTHLSDQRLYAIDPKTKVHSGVFYADGNGKPRRRTPKEITAIVCHQTACLMGESPSRYLHTGCHRVVTRGGQRFKLHAATDVIVSANGFDMRSVSIEGDGLYAGDDSTPELRVRTTWDDPSTKVREVALDLTGPFIAAYIQTIGDICAEVAELGGKVEFLLAHRQSSEDRRDDPGRGIYRQVMLPAAAKYGLRIGPEIQPAPFKIGTGYGVPETWDERAKGVRY